MRETAVHPYDVVLVCAYCVAAAERRGRRRRRREEIGKIDPTFTSDDEIKSLEMSSTPNIETGCVPYPISIGYFVK